MTPPTAPQPIVKVQIFCRTIRSRSSRQPYEWDVLRVGLVSRALPEKQQCQQLGTHLSVAVALVEPDIGRLAHTFVHWTWIDVGLIVECVPQVAAGACHSGLEAAQPLEAPQGLIIIEVALQAAALELGLNLA